MSENIFWAFNHLIEVWCHWQAQFYYTLITWKHIIQKVSDVKIISDVTWNETDFSIDF